ncbi:KPN_02809 family neutral zinc metallopeptidase [Hyphococcus luteus]|uniref:Flagellar biosynthesis protein FlgM n=1 Tax=Hyphococcus luteus TaxID=2058213 RepID=A0A2S7K8G4_9PROT|nr:flagellar biosynthesis protein FlgM [Marinicaulis flavus]
MKWRGRRQSRNVEDRRGVSAGGAGGAGIILLLLRFIFSRFGLGGVVVVGLAGLGLYMAGVDPLQFAGGASPATHADPVDDETSEFVRVILAETEDVWSRQFEAAGSDYPEPTLVMFSGGVTSACGRASAAAGPFYCPGDRKVYLDASFFQELDQRFNAPGDFPAAYVIAHEVGHHIQTITGVSDEVRAAQQRAKGEAEANAYQVMMELQADCYAGVWAHHADRYGDFLDDGDIEEGLRAAAAIGDDTLQRNAGRRVTPESFTHGTSAQRQRWFTTGYRSGDAARCDTFNAQNL